MDSSTFFTLTIGGIVAFVFCYDRVKRLFGKASQATNTQLSEELLAGITEDNPLAPRIWLNYVNHQPDKVPHVAVIGPTGSGKTTITLAILHDRDGQIVVLTGKDGDDWRGLPAIGIDDDLSYTTVKTTVEKLMTEIKQRKLAAKQQRFADDWLTIVFDDFSTLSKECPDAAELVKIVARIGRSLRVRLLMLSDTALVKAIGLEGEGETRSNFAFIRLKRGHAGTLDIDDKAVPIDTREAPQFAHSVFPLHRVWGHKLPSADDYLMQALSLSEPQGALFEASRPDRPDQTRQTEQTKPSDRDLMLKYRKAGVSREAARRLLADDGYTLDNNIWAEIGKEIDV